jgi:hypothetical protein
MIGAKERCQHNISLSLVAKFYRNGVTRERIRQIESGNVTRQIERDYKAALKAAIKATFGSTARPKLRVGVNRSGTASAQNSI